MAADTIRSPASPEVRRALRDAADGIEREGDEIAARIAAVLHREVPELVDDPRSIRDTERASLEIIRSFLRTMRRGEPMEAAEPVPASLATARALARSGRGLGPLLRLCHVGHGTFLVEWEEQLGALDLPPNVLLGATRASHVLTFGWIDRFAQRLSQEYEGERDRLVRSGEAQRAQTIRALLSGTSQDADALSRALGYELGRHHTAMVLWTVESRGDAAAALEGAAAEIARAIGASRPLALSVAGTVTWAWAASDKPPAPDKLETVARRARRDGVSVAIGSPGYGPAGFRTSHRDAEDTFRVALLGGRRPGTVSTYRAVQLAAMLVGDLDRTRRFVRDQLGDLAIDDDEHGRLRATLRVWLDEHGSRQATAQRLGIHANTVGNRVRACQELLGDALGERRVELHVALTLAQALGPAVLRREPG